jgi:hypothetical protein
MQLSSNIGIESLPESSSSKKSVGKGMINDRDKGSPVPIATIQRATLQYGGTDNAEVFGCDANHG